MTEYDLLLIGGFLIGIFGAVTLFTALVDGRSLTAPGIMILIATGLIYVAIGEAPGGRIEAVHIPQAFVKLAKQLAN